MPAFSKEKQEYHKSLIRKVMIVKRNASLLEIQEQLENNGLHLHAQYIRKIRDKIFEERSKWNDKHTKQRHYKELEEILMNSLDRAYEIIYAKHSKASDVIQALREIRETWKTLFDIKADLKIGDFEKHIGTIEFRPKTSLDSERINIIVEAMVNFGILKKNESPRLEEPTVIDGNTISNIKNI